MKICPNPNCKRENPSRAKLCMFCGTALVEEEHPTPQNPLGMELDEMKKDIEQLKLLFAEFREKSGNNEKETGAEQLTKQIEDRNATIKTLSGQIDEKKTEISTLTNQLEKERKNKKGGKWGWIFVLLSLAFAIGTIWLWDCYTSEKKRGDHLYNTIKELKSKNDSLQTAYRELQDNYNSLSAKYPMIIESVDIVQVNKDVLRVGDTIRDYKEKDELIKQKPWKRSERVIEISYIGYMDGDVKVEFRWVRNGSYYDSFTETLTIKAGRNKMQINRQNCIVNSNWPTDYYKLEVWCNNVELKSKSFYSNNYR